MHSQKEFKPIYGSFSGREAIEVVTKNSQKNMALKVPFNIGFPSIRRGGTKIKVTPLKPKDYGKEQNVSYSQAVMKAKQFVSTANRQMTQANKIITTQASSTVITNGDRSSTLVKPSITTQVSLGNKSSVNQPTSQIVSSISNKSSSANIQSCPSSPDKSPIMTGPDSHISNANNLLYNAADCSPSTSVNSAANFSRSIPNCSSSKAPMNVLNGSDMSSSQQNNAINYTRDTKPSSLTVQSQQEDGFVNSTVSAATMKKPSVWNGVNSKVVNPTGVKEGSMTVRSQHTTNQHQPVRNSPSNKVLQSGPNTNAGVGKESLGSVAMKPQQNHSVIGNTPSIVTTGKVNTVWNGINGSLKEQNILGNVIAEQSSSRRSSTSNSFNNIALKDPTSSSVKYVEQQESDNKNNALSVTSTPSSSRRSSESNGTNSKELPSSSVKNNAKQKKRKGDNGSKISSGLNTPSQSNTPDGSRRSSTSNGSNPIFAPKESIKNVVRQVELDSRSNVSSVSINTQNISRQPSESNGSKTTSNLSSSEKSKNNINSSLNLSSYKQPSNERPINENANMSLNSNGSVPSNKSSMNWAHLFSKDESQKATNENSKSNVTKPPSLPVRSQRSQKAVSLTNGEPKVGGLTGLLKDFDPSFRNVTMNPRGLINNGNMCFMNAILQTLSHCPPFCNLLTRIYKEVVHDFNNKTPLVDSLVRFIEEYKQMKRFEGSEEFGEAFSPEYVYDALRGLKRFDSMKGRQEDAEEFLGFLLGGLHEEFLSVLKKDELKNQQSDKAVKTSVKGNQNDDWMEVGRKNRTSYTRTTDVEETPISRIFCGQFRSVLTCSGSNSITLQPYQSLQLDIQPDDVKTIGDALKNLTVPEYVDDFYSPKSGLVRATKRLCIERLPPILTLHLKRFIYDNVGGTQKLSKHIGYSTTLSIQPDIMAHRPSNPSKAVEYQLFGVVYHHGKSATGGHYTADILCRNNWLHIDDTVISSISSSEVASVENPTQPTDRSAYILFYMKN